MTAQDNGNTLIIIRKMIHDIMNHPDSPHTMITRAMDSIAEKGDCLLGKELYVRILINQLVSVNEMAKSSEIKHKIHATIHSLFELLGKTRGK